MTLLGRLLLLSFLTLLTSARAQFSFAGASDHVKTSLVADTTAIEAGKPFTVGVRFDIAETWDIYWRFGGDLGLPTRVDWELPEGFRAGPLQWPLPEAHLADGDIMNYIYRHEAVLLSEITPPAQLPPGSITLKAKLNWQMCDPSTCIPAHADVALALPAGTAAPANQELFTKTRAQLPKEEPPPFRAEWTVKPDVFTVKLSGLPQGAKIEFFPIPPDMDAKPKRPQIAGDTITVPIESGGAADTAWSGLLVAKIGEGPRSGWMLSPSGTAPVTTASAAAKGAPLQPAPPRFGLFGALWAALLGGLILNLMPCVLPVIALKIFSFVSQAGEHPERVFRLGLAFVAGVFVFFLGIAGLAIGLRAAGQGFFWGMQFADPRLMLALVALVVLFALSMFGVFEITLGGAENTLGALSRKEGYGGAFVHGLFTTLLGTSCTAPFVGPVLGFAVTQPPLAIVAIFIAMATGMSLPYFLLTWKPAWMRFLPKPGMWMERFKQFMGFVLLAVAVWLLGVFSKTRGADAGAAAGWLLLFLALAGWIFGAGGRRWWAIALAALTLAAGTWLFLPEALHKGASAEEQTKPNAVGIAWEKFTPERVEKARQSGQSVFIDFTAEWCVNCKVNEKGVINTAPVAAAFKEKNVLTLRADWTDFDPVITEWLKKFERIGVPVYVLYRPGEDAPVVFPELLTTNSVLGELGKIQR
jgi:thiol:disulfide interchange protein DsbD